MKRLFLVVVAASACSSTGSERASADAGATPDAGSAGGAPVDAGTAACTDLAADGAVVANATLAKRTEAPSPTGGAIPDGTYELTSAVLYGGSRAALGESSVWRFAGTTLDQASKDGANGPAQRFRATYSFAPDAKGRQKLEWTCACATEGPSCTARAGTFARLYSVDGDKLVYFNDDPADPTIESVLVRTFTRRK